MKNIKKITLILILLLITFTINAEKFEVKVNWHATNEGIKYFRYQLNGEDPDKWIVTPSTNTSAVLTDLSSEKDNTLYLQQSRDGVTWSGFTSKIIPATAVKKLKEAKAFEDSKKTERITNYEKKTIKEETVVENETNTVITSSKIETVTKKVTKQEIFNNKNIMISPFFGSYVAAFNAVKVNNITFQNLPSVFIYMGVDASFNNLVRWGNKSGLGVKVGLSYQAIPDQTHSSYSSIVKEINKKGYTHKLRNFFGSLYNNTDFYLAAAYDLNINKYVGFEFITGMFATISWPAKCTYNANMPKKSGFIFGNKINANISGGILLSAKANFYITDLISIGLTPGYRYEIGNPKGNQLLVQTSVGFRF